ncbi:hypothetical protein HJA95_14290 [Rhizobium binae]|uniref:hypothetical protein n=1 Tax=Rhizobium binae TaxID=1138190 RepID=UPI001C8305AF|nr:hypothetical protein [Rhizobium binae]MBX4950724.1 hypothetical protein [Rhizobium binae]
MIGIDTTTWVFEEIVRLSGYKNVVTMNFPPVVWLHDGDSDERIVINEVASYYLSSQTLPTDPQQRARYARHRLQELGDWAAGEIVGRHLRDQERLESGYHNRRPRLTVPQMLVRRFVKNNSGSLMAKIALGFGLPESEVADILVELCGKGILLRRIDLGATYELTVSELARYASLID